ncbi:cation diffusion facilitator family transporter [Polynucleobacter paneuropaeus]|uniref:cation diffusion facilitator family transporter n=1 Tax=Polynucleobacter paneuropaeus TaxID=2527775 RepID=UPI001BFDB61D|nr:cation diffusion facilitator family transporter [Polynucleobacter paneuropaeus]MBT8574586.1 cation transporter [Polynucleobacter paneuropaeus]MBT8609418.1 cation transporter [Polynucleobacter paneuropaeus]MBT8634622.1 cation transporter [Polynucleobacter paneuropaeus]QWD07882.1 cation transporter [Polynucleobacter paneuropaeus]QWD51345.1 cation transporter [Polynucleobacter paneuropaeus]
MDDLIENPEDASAEKQSAAKKSTLVSVAVNLTLTVSQVFAGLLSGSQGLIADGIHSLTDLIADFVVLFANHHSAKDADEDHHYGHQRYETAASLFLGISLLAVALGMLWSAGHKIVNPIAPSQISILALYVALGSLVAKELLFRYMLAVAERVRSSMLVANAWHARSDAASSLVVSVGIVGALLGFPILDSVGALIVGLMIIRTGWSFSWDALNDLMDRAVSEEEHQHIEKIILSTEGVLGCHDLRTRKMGDMILVDVHIEVDANATVQVGHDIALTAANQVKAELPVLNVMTHIDPI